MAEKYTTKGPLFYVRPLLGIVCFVFFASGWVAAQNDLGGQNVQTSGLDSQSSGTANRGDSNNTASGQRINNPGTAGPEHVAVIKSISPKVLSFDIPQPLFSSGNSLTAEERQRYKDEYRTVVVTGANFPKPDSTNGENAILVKIGREPARAFGVAGDQTAFWARLDVDQLNHLPMGTHLVSVEIGATPARIDESIQSGTIELEVIRPAGLGTTTVVVISAFIAAFVILFFLVYAGSNAFVKSPKVEGDNGIGRFFRGFKWTLVDTETNTMSLSRAQFAWWLLIIIFGYLILFIGRGLTRGVWEYISLSGFAYAFLISLGTLIAAQGTSALRGNKGTGDVDPGWSDLVVHGGVFAFERVQQVAWNVIVGVIFIIIVIKTYDSAISLPVIPQELLALMGISAAGYIGGKAIRNPGPNIRQVTSDKGYKLITIEGDCLSNGGLAPDGTEDKNVRDSGVTIQLTDGGGSKELKRDKVVTIEQDPSKPTECARKLQVGSKTDSDWTKWFDDAVAGGETTIVVINADGQKATWRGRL